jgi:hypothetical protein
MQVLELQVQTFLQAWKNTSTENAITEENGGKVV